MEKKSKPINTQVYRAGRIYIAVSALEGSSERATHHTKLRTKDDDNVLQSKVDASAK